MAFSINEFRANVAAGGGLLKNNKFLIRITPPVALAGNSAFGANRFLEYYAETVNLPGISLQTSEIRRQGIGNIERNVWGAAFTDCNIAFRVDQKTQIWNLFQTWMNTIYNFNLDNSNGKQGTLFELEYKDNFATTLSIFVYNEIHPENPVVTIDLIDAFPLSMSDMDLNWGGNELIKLNVRFNFRSWNLRDNGTAIQQTSNFEPAQYDALGNVTIPAGIGINKPNNTGVDQHITSSVSRGVNRQSNIFLNY
jgi:hypothetical protein